MKKNHQQLGAREDERDADANASCRLTASRQYASAESDGPPTDRTPSPGRGLGTLLGLLVAWLLNCSPAGGTVLYQTSFEHSEGYDTNLDLVGQAGWVGIGSGGNGVVTGFPAGKGQQAYIGFSPPATNETTLYIFHPVNKRVPRAQFSVTLDIEDSSNNNWDDFYWAVFNQQGKQLVTLDFDNFYTNVFYWLEGSTNRTETGVKFSNGMAYQLNMILDFTNNRWSATLGSNLLATNQPITLSGASLDLGDIDAAWNVYATNAPGDNFMVFDNYQISASMPPPQLKTLGLVNGLPTIRVTGLADYQFALETATDVVNWLPLKTNITTGGSFDYVDDSAAGLSQRFYRARWVP